MRNAIVNNLLQQPNQFEFLQAVRLLENYILNKPLAGHEDSPNHEFIKFEANDKLHFFPSDIECIEKKQEKYIVRVDFLSLIGASGILPLHYHELALLTKHKYGSYIQDFLNMFQHRAISLYYRAMCATDFLLDHENAEKSHANESSWEKIMASLASTDSENPSDLKLYYAALFNMPTRSASGLENILSDIYQLSVKVHSFDKQSVNVPDQECSHLSVQYAMNKLGCDAVLGNQLWYGQTHFTLQLF